MATIVDVTRAMKAVRTANQGVAIIDDALLEVRNAQKTGRIPTDLANSLAELETFRRRIRGASLVDFPSVWESGKATITRAYVNVAGAVGEFQARQAVSLLDELAKSAKEAPALIGETVGNVAGGVGDVAGSLVGGLLKGLGPIVLVVIGFVLYAKYAKK